MSYFNIEFFFSHHNKIKTSVSIRRREEMSMNARHWSTIDDDESNKQNKNIQYNYYNDVEIRDDGGTA